MAIVATGTVGNDRDSRPEQEREQRYRHGSVGLGTGDLDVRIDVGDWHARG